VADAVLRDEVLRAFAATLDQRFTIVDLRGVRPGWASRGTLRPAHGGPPTW